MELRGKVAVVTGAASGIGRSAAVALARGGADLVVADLNSAGLTEVLGEVQGLGRRGLAVPADVSKLADVQNLYDRSIAEMGGVDILVNNAGVHMMGAVDKTALEDWKWIIDINLYGVIHGISVFLPHMLERGSGHIVNTCSSAGLVGSLDASIPYTTTKFAVAGLSEGLAVYVREKGIGVTMVCPGLVSTNIMAGQRFVPLGDGLDQARLDFAKIIETHLKQGTLANLLPGGGDPRDAAMATVITPDQIAALVVRAIRENTFLVVAPDEIMEIVRERSQDMEGHIDRQAKTRAERERFFNAVLTQMAQARNA